ncbi:MAG: glycosyltransferase family 39 protein [Verrucomicrobia bacterium]|nr:glycosyltransferase family 39 protein [Verrucomicrobiota bacterium]
MGQEATKKDRWGLLLFAALVAFPFLGSFGLLEPDEGRFAQVGREMMAGGDFLVPRLNGIEQFYKPPLVYWINAVGYRVLGITEWTARLPSALAFFGTIGLTGWMGWRLGGRKLGWVAALILASMLEPYALGRQITLDTTLTFWVTAALACLVRVATGDQAKKSGFLFFLCLGLGFLAKGPMAWVVPMTAALTWTMALRAEGQRLGLPWMKGLLLMSGVSLSWFLAVCWKYPELWKYFLGYELVERFASTTHGRSKPFWFFFPILAVGTIPWTGFLPGLTWAAWRKVRNRSLSPAQWALGAAVVIPFVIVSCSGSKLLTYILPIYPSLALALAFWLEKGEMGIWGKIGWGTAWGILLVFSPLLWGVQFFWSEAVGISPSSPYLIGVLIAVVVTGLVVWKKRKKPFAAVGGLALVAILVWHGACLEIEGINDLLGRQASVRPLARLVEKHQPERLFIYRARAAGLLFITDRTVWINRADADVVIEPSAEAKGRFFEKPEDLRQGLSQGQRVEGITLRHVFHEEFDPSRWEVVGRSGEFLLVRAYGAGI